MYGWLEGMFARPSADTSLEERSFVDACAPLLDVVDSAGGVAGRFSSIHATAMLGASPDPRLVEALRLLEVDDRPALRALKPVDQGVVLLARFGSLLLEEAAATLMRSYGVGPRMEAHDWVRLAGIARNAVQQHGRATTGPPPPPAEVTYSFAADAPSNGAGGAQTAAAPFVFDNGAEFTFGKRSESSSGFAFHFEAPDFDRRPVRVPVVNTVFGATSPAQPQPRQPLKGADVKSLDQQLAKCSLCHASMHGARWSCMQCEPAFAMCPPCHMNSRHVGTHVPTHTFECRWPPTLPWTSEYMCHADTNCYLLELSDDVLIVVCLRLTLPDLGALLRTCKRLSHMRTWNVLWRGVARLRFPHLVAWADCGSARLYSERLRLARDAWLNAPPSHTADPSFCSGFGPTRPLPVAQQIIRVEDVDVRPGSAVVMHGTVIIISDTGVVMAGNLRTGELLWSVTLDDFGDATVEPHIFTTSDGPFPLRDFDGCGLVGLPDVGVVATDTLSVWQLTVGGVGEVKRIFTCGPSRAMRSALAVVGSQHVAFVSASVRPSDRPLFASLDPEAEADAAVWLVLRHYFPSLADNVRGYMAGVRPTMRNMLRSAVLAEYPAPIELLMSLRALSVPQAEALLGDPELVGKLRERLAWKDESAAAMMGSALRRRPLGKGRSGNDDADDVDDNEDDDDEEDDDDGEGDSISDDHDDTNTRTPLPGGCVVLGQPSLSMFGKTAKRTLLAAAQDLDFSLMLIDVKAPADSSPTTILLPLELVCACAGFPLTRDAFLAVGGELRSWELYVAVPLQVFVNKSAHLVVLLVHATLGVVASSQWFVSRDTSLEDMHSSLVYRGSNVEAASIIDSLLWVSVARDRGTVISDFRELPLDGPVVAREGHAHVLLPPDNMPVAAGSNPATGMLYIVAEYDDGGEDFDLEPAAAVTCYAYDLTADARELRWQMRVEHAAGSPGAANAPTLGGQQLLQLVSCNMVRVCDGALFLGGAHRGLVVLARVDLDGAEPRLSYLHGFPGILSQPMNASVMLMWDASDAKCTHAAVLCDGHLAVLSDAHVHVLNAALEDLLRQRPGGPLGMLNMFHHHMHDYLGHDGGSDEEENDRDADDDDDDDEDGDGEGDGEWCDSCGQYH